MLQTWISSWSWAGTLGLAKRFVLPLVIVAGWLWLFSWPHFEGNYVGAGGLTTVQVTSRGGRLQVAVSRREGDTVQNSVSGATTDYTTLLFGDGIERGALVFHPFNARSYELVTGSGRTRLSKNTWVSQLAVAHPLAALALISAAMAVWMLAMVGNKAKTDPHMIHPMWLAYFVALFFSTAILLLAGEAHIFNYDGEPQNAVARAIVAGTGFFVDVVPECGALLIALALIVLPQWFAYGMSGLSGAARRSRFVWIAWKWAALLIAKSFISASAIALSIALVGGYFGWVSSEPRGVAANVLAALMLLGFGIFLLCVVPTRPKQGMPGKTVRRVHRHMRRRLRRGPGEIAAQLQRELNQPEGQRARLPFCSRVSRFFRDV
jgi:hypothetical protein